jgi:hypothetical protein
MPTTTLSKRVKMIWGLSLHGWEDVMRGSLAAVGVFGLIVGIATWYVVKLQRVEIEASSKEIEELRSANLALEKQISPRRLSAGQQEAIAAALTKFAGRAVDVASYGQEPESWGLAQQILNSLKLAKIKFSDSSSTILIIGGFITGIKVEGTDAELVAAIVVALAENGAPADFQLHNSTGSPMGALAKNPPPSAARIFVGIKPMQIAK